MEKLSLVFLVVMRELFPHPTLKVWDVRNRICHYLALPPLAMYLEVLPPLAIYLDVLHPPFILYLDVLPPPAILYLEVFPPPAIRYLDVLPPALNLVNPNLDTPNALLFLGLATGFGFVAVGFFFGDTGVCFADPPKNA